jgi:hypothetical protein
MKCGQIPQEVNRGSRASLGAGATTLSVGPQRGARTAIDVLGLTDLFELLAA